jgi:uncharacterized membrane protein
MDRRAAVLKPQNAEKPRPVTMKRNTLYLVIALLTVGVVVIGYLLYQERQSGISIEIGERGVTIEGN